MSEILQVIMLLLLVSMNIADGLSSYNGRLPAKFINLLNAVTAFCSFQEKIPKMFLSKPISFPLTLIA